ncbi:MAG: hypothetical protein LBP72_01135 [Dysgonamonadaceae bacterium]|jgi:hypothetical protein|nr:hypothetical protein [Dysgonamonadaceae bacterium]
MADFDLIIQFGKDYSAGLAALQNSVDIYNVTQKVPLQSGYYTAATARAAVPTAIRKKGLIITYRTSDAIWKTEQFYKGETSAWTTADNWRSMDGLDIISVSSIADLYEKLNDASLWLNKYNLSEKTIIRTFRFVQWIFTLIVVKSDAITQYLFGPTILNEDGTFNDATYFESYIIKRTISNSGTVIVPWHYVDKPDFVNIDAFKPLASGYYTPDTAHAALPNSMRKQGIVITYRTAASAWATERYVGTSWQPFVAEGGGGGDVDLSEIEDDIEVLQKTSFKYLASDTNLNMITALGAYYIGTAEISGAQLTGGSKDFLFVVGNKLLSPTEKVNDITQYRITNGEITMRKHYPAYGNIGNITPASWDEWTSLGAQTTPIATMTESAYEALEEIDENTLYFLT